MPDEKPTPPQPTANAPLNLVRGKPTVIQYPTPQLADRVFKIRKDPRKGEYELPSPGDPYAGPYKTLLKDFVFATAKPTEDNQVDWFFVNQRKNQDAYNFTIAFPYNDKDFPALTRTYVVLRTDSLAKDEPQADTTDPVFEELLLTDHKILRMDDPIFDSVFVSVQRVFERLPGPIITSYGTNKYLQKTTSRMQEVVKGPSPKLSALVEASTQERTGTAKAKNTSTTVDSVFPADVYKEELPNFFREEFMAAFTTDIHSQRQAGQASPPALAAGQFSITDTQENEFVHVIEEQTQALPQTRNSKELGGQPFGAGIIRIQTTVDEPNSDLDIDEGYTVIESQLRDLGPFGKIKTSHFLIEPSDPRVDMLTNGSGYDNTTTVGFTGGTIAPGGHAATGHAILGYSIASATVDSSGIQYAYPPFVQVVGDGYGAIFQAVLGTGVNAGKVVSLTKISGGDGYTYAYFRFVGGQGGGASAHGTLASTGSVQFVVLDDPGNYVSADEDGNPLAPPTVVITGTGTGATAEYHISSFVWPDLFETETDPHYGIVILTLKKTVPAPAAYPGRPAAVSGVGDGYIDIKAYDRWRSIQMTSRIDLRSLPPPLSWPTTHEVSLPNTLLGVDVVHDIAGGGSASASMARSAWDGSDSPASSTLGILSGAVLEQSSSIVKGGNATVETTVSGTIWGAISTRIMHGHHGPTNAEITRMFFFGPPPASMIPIPLSIREVTATATLIGKSVKFTDTVGNQVISKSNEGHLRAEVMHIPNVLSGGIRSTQQLITDGRIPSTNQAFANGSLEGANDPHTESTGPYDINLLFQLDIPISQPDILLPGSWICWAAPVEEWRFGVYVVHVLMVQVPYG